MNKSGKQLSNPTSTGGAGVHFENRIQSSFVILLLAGGVSPCIPPWPIQKIKLQGRYQGYETDDIIIYAKHPNGHREAKLLGQIKHHITFTERNLVLKDVIQAAWNDFTSQTFNEKSDSIALITGPLSAKDTIHVRALLEQARNAENALDFFKRVNLAKFTSNEQREKLNVIKSHLKSSNNDIYLSDDQVWRFLKRFHLLIYDLDIKGVTLSLLHTLIGQYSKGNIEDLWARIVNEVTYKSANAGIITLENLPEEISSVFYEPHKRKMPEELVGKFQQEVNLNWTQNSYVSDLVIANLVGGWDENNEEDRKLITNLAKKEYTVWIANIRELLLGEESPLIFKEGIWKVINRESLWNSMGPRIFDDTLETIKDTAIEVLSELDPKFRLSANKRLTARITGAKLKYSETLRNGLAESLALIQNRTDVLDNCSLGRPEFICKSAIKAIFANNNWELWASLDSLLPVIAESSPKEFLDAVDTGLNINPCPFDELFRQEGEGIIGGTYISGLLWALEALAWEEGLLIPVTIILGELAKRDPGGNWSNRPINSLIEIFLPWFPQTFASIEKRKAAVQTLIYENPDMAWHLLVKLLPNETEVSTGTKKPIWRNKVPHDWNENVKTEHYREQVNIYAAMAINLAKSDNVKLTDLIKHLDNIPRSFLIQTVEYLTSENISNIPEQNRIMLWNELTEVVLRHKYHSSAEWAFSLQTIEELEKALVKISPKDPVHLHSILFNNMDRYFYNSSGDWIQQKEIFEEKRKEAIIEILKYGGIESVIRLTERVEQPYFVGITLGVIDDQSIMDELFPNFLFSSDNQLSIFIKGFIQGLYRTKGWQWIDEIDMKNWLKEEIAQLLVNLPFALETWNRVEKHLKSEERLYWSKADTQHYLPEEKIGVGFDKLLEYERPISAINYLGEFLIYHQYFDSERAIKGLLSAALSRENSPLDPYKITEIIKALQQESTVDPDDLLQIEWLYLSVLTNKKVGPKELENRLSSDPNLFCEVIQLVYRSSKTSDENKGNNDNERQKSLATNAYKLLRNWRTPPGTTSKGEFSGKALREWIEKVKLKCQESGHLNVALSHIGNVLFYSPEDTEGLWINRDVAKILNEKGADKIRTGFNTEIFNSRGVYWVDPTGKAEKEIAENYRNKTEDIENAGFYRFAQSLRETVKFYEEEAERVRGE